MQTPPALRTPRLPTPVQPVKNILQSPLSAQRFSSRIPFLLASTFAVFLIAQSANAATKTFSAGTSWSLAGNWSPSVAPGSGDALLFSTFTPATTTLDANVPADTLSFNTSGTMAIDANASGTNGRTLTLNNTSANANGTNDIISLLGGGTINLGVTSGKGVIALALVAAANNINVANGGSLVLGPSSIISGTGKALSFTGNSTGMLTLSGANTFNGSLTLSSGVVRATTSTAALGAGTLSLGGGELQLANDTALNFARATTVTANAQITSDRLTAGSGVTQSLSTLSIGSQTLTVAGGSNVNSGTAGVTFTGATALTGNAIFNVTNPAGGGATVLTFANAITGGANTFTKTGNGTVVFSGTTNNNTYTGLTTVSGGELDLGKTAGSIAIAGNVTVGNGTLKLLTANQLADTSTVTITTGGTFNMNTFGDTFAGLNISSSGANATFDLGTQAASNPVKITGAAPTLTFGANTLLAGSGTLTQNTLNATMTFNFDGGQLSGAVATASGANATSTTILNVTAGMGGGSIIAGGSANLAGTTLAVNLNQTGTMNLGSTILAYSNSSGGRPTLLNVTVANTATGMSGGIISTALTANAADPVVTSPNDLKNNVANTLTFTAGGTGFTLSGGIIDVRSNVATAGFGAITTNGNSLTISGGTLLGNSLASTTGNITLSSGYLGLRNTGSANFTISNTTANDGRTIQMVSGSNGTFTVASGTANQRLIIGNQTTGGTWDYGTLNAGQNYTIVNSGGTSPFSATTANYTIAANSGLNGVLMGASAIPTQLNMGSNSSFFSANSTSAARIYNVGVGGANDIAVASSGNLSFGVNNTIAANTQIINLNRDKGADTVTLISNGASTSSGVNISGNQTGAGNLYVLTKILTLNSGVTFSGNGTIANDIIAGNLNGNAGINDFPMGNFAGNIAGAGSSIGIVFNINGTINGTNTVSLNQDNNSGSSFVLGSTASVGGTQNWVNAQSNVQYFSVINFANSMTTPSNWTNGSITFNSRGTAGTFEASTSTATPGSSSNYKFAALNITSGAGSTTGAYKLTNTVQNDGGSAKEAFYAGSFSVAGGIGDGSNGHYIFNLAGQDLYVDRFNNITGVNLRGLSFQNDSLNTTSTIRAVSTTGDSMSAGGFQVLNGATLEVSGGNYNALVFQRNTGGNSGALLVADTAAAPNGGGAGNTNVKQTLSQNGTAMDIGTFTSFLGSGADNGGNTNISAQSTNGTMRITGGTFSSSGYILNPVGTTGLLDTTDGITDTTLNDVLIRGNTASDANGAGVSSAYPALIVAGTTTINGNLIIGNATGAANQATLRVGGDSAVGYSTSTGPSAHSGNGTLIVAGDLTTQSAVNVSIQSNGNVKAAGNVSIAGVGTNVSFTLNPITGKDGVGINAASNFTLNGDKGSGTPQTVNIIPGVGKFHVGDGIGGTLTGTAAQVILSGNLTAAGNADVNGAGSILNLGGNTMTLTGGSVLTVGGTLGGNGTVAGAVVIVSGGTLSPGNSPGLLTLGSLVLDSGSTSVMQLEAITARGSTYDAVDVTGALTYGGTLSITLNPATAVAGNYDLFDFSSQTGTFFAINFVDSGAAGTFDYTTGILSLTSVPEPSTWALLAFSLTTVMILRRRRSYR